MSDHSKGEDGVRSPSAGWFTFATLLCAWTHMVPFLFGQYRLYLLRYFVFILGKELAAVITASGGHLRSFLIE
jgi:hypothetical protein